MCVRHHRSFFPAISSSAAALLFSVIFFGASVDAAIQGSAHDFTAFDGTICDPCHTPHNAQTGVPSAPLWDHTITTATFDTYTSPTMDLTVNSPEGVSKLCLSCHDGTVAIGSYGGSTGTDFMTGDALTGTDLSNDHPISIDWNEGSNGAHSLMGPFDCSKCHTLHSGPSARELVFFNGNAGSIECATCHDVHNDKEIDKLLRVSMVGSELCLICHQDK